MNGEEVQRRSAARAQELPGAEITHPFGLETDVFVVRGKLFMLHSDATGAPTVILKSAPEDAEALRATFAEITPGYHMNKRHWISLHGGSLDPELVDELVTESYRLVVQKLPRAQRPVDPATFGHRR